MDLQPLNVNDGYVPAKQTQHTRGQFKFLDGDQGRHICALVHSQDDILRDGGNAREYTNLQVIELHVAMKLVMKNGDDVPL